MCALYRQQSQLSGLFTISRLLLPEAIAIVLAPRRSPSFSIFKLIDPKGIKAIASCKKSDPFHSHDAPDSDLYFEIDPKSSGLIEFLSSSSSSTSPSLHVIDLRKWLNFYPGLFSSTSVSHRAPNIFYHKVDPLIMYSRKLLSTMKHLITMKHFDLQRNTSVLIKLFVWHYRWITKNS